MLKVRNTKMVVAIADMSPHTVPVHLEVVQFHLSLLKGPRSIRAHNLESVYQYVRVGICRFLGQDADILVMELRKFPNQSLRKVVLLVRTGVDFLHNRNNLERYFLLRRDVACAAVWGSAKECVGELD